LNCVTLISSNPCRERERERERETVAVPPCLRLQNHHLLLLFQKMMESTQVSLANTLEKESERERDRARARAKERESETERKRERERVAAPPCLRLQKHHLPALLQDLMGGTQGLLANTLEKESERERERARKRELRYLQIL